MSSAILTYHSIDKSASVISVSPEMFRRHMENLAESAVPVVPLRRILDVENSIAITFDDGFANFETDALPILAQHGFPATVFLVSGYCGRENNWAGQSPKAPRLPLLSWTSVRELGANDIEWGAHTANHADLTALQDVQVNSELLDCVNEIEQRIGRAVQSFAYPYGRCDQRVRAAAAKRFDRCCGTRLNYLGPNADPSELPRLDMYYLSDPEHVKHLMTAKVRSYIAVRRLLREGKQWLSR